jgi:hypothetical protein
VLGKFNSARESLFPVHDINLQFWALQAAKEFEYSSFKASKNWINSFKKIIRIASRKVTKIVSKDYHENLPNVYLDALSFVLNVNENCNVDRNIFNPDQSGFNL